MSDQPKICRYCGGAILWGLKPNGGQGDHRPLDAESARATYMVLNGAVYYGYGYDVHNCKEDDIRAWNLKLDMQAKEKKPPRKRTPRKKPEPKPQEKQPFQIAPFEVQAKMYLDSLQKANLEEYFEFQEAQMVGWSTRSDFESGEDSHRRRRDADHWMNALKVVCPKCDQPENMLCISMNVYHKGRNILIQNPHPQRVKLAEKEQ